MESEENENDLPPLIPIEEEKESDDEQENEDCSDSDQGSSGEEGGDATLLVSEPELRSTLRMNRKMKILMSPIRTALEKKEGMHRRSCLNPTSYLRE